MRFFGNKSARPRDEDATDADTALIIDDDIGTRLSLARVIRGLGYQALTAGDGNEGIKLLERYAPYIACVLLDMEMPRQSAIAILARIRAISWYVPVLLLRSGTEPLAPLLEYGQVFVMAKPFKAEQARAAFQRALGH